MVMILDHQLSSLMRRRVYKKLTIPQIDLALHLAEEHRKLPTDILSRNELARWLGVHVKTLDMWRRRGLVSVCYRDKYLTTYKVSQVCRELLKARRKQLVSRQKERSLVL